MANALLPADRPTQPHQGVGARVARRLGRAFRGAFRGAFAGITRRRRPAAPPQAPTPRPTQAPEAATPPRRPRTPRRPRPAAPAPASRPGWIARWFGFGRRSRPAPRLALSDIPDEPFTPKAYPGFPPEVCELLNTPVEDCDPVLLYLTLAVLARCIAEELPPELGLDAKALFSTLWGRLAGPFAELLPDIGAAGQPADAVPDATQDPPQAQPAPQTPDVPQSAAAVATQAARPAPPQPGHPRNRWRNRGWLFRRCRSWLSRLRRNRRRMPPPSRLYYACTGPP